MTTAVYNVTGMTCGHCVHAVSTELGKLPGVTGVEVDLETGDVTVQSDRPLELGDVHTAVDEAGYELAPGRVGR
jgi:copper ion binding protein